MTALFMRAVRSFLCITAATTLMSNTAAAEANASLYSADLQPFSSSAPLIEVGPPHDLLYTAKHQPTEELSPEKIYVGRNSDRYSQADLACLAEALYFEARGEGAKGQVAVAEVILNRVQSRKFPSNVCSVINQPSQFSYTIGGKKKVRNKAAYQRVLKVAKAVLAGQTQDVTGGATYFHTTSVRPGWAGRMLRTSQIGRHIFYKSQARVASN